jgi:acetyl-CoA carboxylase carboxyltransferase component
VPKITARSWIDAIIQPRHTREILVRLLSYARRSMPQGARFHMGVAQT